MHQPVSLTQRISAQISAVRQGEKQRARLRGVLEWLHDKEIAMVLWQVDAARRGSLRALARAVNHLSNGWLFVLYGVALSIYQGWSAALIIFAALLSLGITHVIYPVLKAYIARLRPMDRVLNLTSEVRPLDRYSCPSGHCMTAMALSVPIVFTLPDTAAVLFPIVALIGWARIAVAHHYPSDLFLGVLLGYVVAWPVSHLLF